MDLIEIDSNLILISLDEAGILLFFNVPSLKINNQLSESVVIGIVFFLLLKNIDRQVSRFDIDKECKQILITIDNNGMDEYKVLMY